MKSINKNQLKLVGGGGAGDYLTGFPISLKVCATGKIVQPPLTTDSNVMKGLTTVLLHSQGAANGFQGIDVLVAGQPIGSNLCPQDPGSYL